MAVNKVELYVSQILEDLDNGLTWLKRDDVGYGSIQEKYNAKDQQIVMIRKHPKLKDAETNVTVFTVIDDTDERNTTTVSTDNRENAVPVASVPGSNTVESRGSTDVPGISNETTGDRDAEPATITDEQSADAFFNI